MTDWLLLAVAAATATSLSAPVVLWLLRRHGAIDVPNHRSSHEVPTVRGGGVACALGILITAAGAQALGVSVPWLCLGAALVMALLGLITDLRDLPATSRLLLQILVGAALGAALGGLVSILLGAVAFPVLVNAVNFMDGINGITGLTVASWAIVVLTLGPPSELLVLALLAGAAALAFLPWNLPKARMFLGDCGSYLFGGLIAAALVSQQVAGDVPWWLLLAPLLPYLLDTGLTLARRAARGEDLAQAHREHLYQHLVRRTGWTHARVAVLYAALALFAGAGSSVLLGT